jgi:hypothetical protein
VRNREDVRTGQHVETQGRRWGSVGSVQRRSERATGYVPTTMVTKWKPRLELVSEQHTSTTGQQRQASKWSTPAAPCHAVSLDPPHGPPVHLVWQVTEPDPARQLLPDHGRLRLGLGLRLDGLHPSVRGRGRSRAVGVPVGCVRVGAGDTVGCGRAVGVWSRGWGDRAV